MENKKAQPLELDENELEKASGGLNEAVNDSGLIEPGGDCLQLQIYQPKPEEYHQ